MSETKSTTKRRKRVYRSGVAIKLVDYRINRANVVVNDRSTKGFRSMGVTVYGVTPEQLVEELKERNRRFFDRDNPPVPQVEAAPKTAIEPAAESV